MAWVASRGMRSVIEVDWPADVPKPAVPESVLYPDPREFALQVRERAEVALKACVGGKYGDTGRVITDATPADFKLSKVRLSLAEEGQGHCSLIR